MAYGSPNSLDEVGDYLAQVRGGRVSTPEEIEHLKQRYQRVGGQTPLLQITKSQADALEKKLVADGAPARVSFGMKHWHPFIEDVVEKISIDNPPILVGLALAPHYSKLSIGGYEDSVRRGLARKYPNVPFVMLKNWHTEPSLITALSNKGTKQILVCPIGFVSDHLEILYDLDVEARDYANSHGIELARTLSLNDDPKFIEALAAVATPILVRRILTH